MTFSANHPKHSHLRRYYRTGDKDYIQDAFLFVWERMHKYDPARGALSTFVFKLAADGMRRGVRQGSARGAFGLKQRVVRDENGKAFRRAVLPPATRPLLDRYADEHRGFGDVDAADAVGHAKRDLLPHYREAIEAWARGEAPIDFGRRRGLARQTVHDHIRRGLSAMRRRVAA